MGIKHTGSDNSTKTYFYRKNVQGDIIALLDSSGKVVVKYVYDAWGDCKVLDANGKAWEIPETHIGALNPFRYRGYYYDTETELYYLKTRYYDPETGRFITIDDLSYLDPETINGLNLYAYCGNNPVMNVDENGTSFWSWLLGGLSLLAGIALCFVPSGQAFGVGLIVGGATSLVSCSLDAAGVSGKWASIITSGLSILAGIALCFTPFAGIGAGMIGQGVGAIAGGFISEACGGSFMTGAAIGGIIGGIVGGAAYKAYDTYKIKQIAKQGSVVIGETMTRVQGAANKINAGTFKTSKFAQWLYGDGNHGVGKVLSKLGSKLTMSQNITWIRRVAQSGVDIVNIGIDVTRIMRSSFYIMELQSIYKYLLLC